MTTSTLLPMLPVDGEPRVGGSVDGAPVLYRDWTLPIECSTALGWGCTMGYRGRLSVPISMGHPHVRVFDHLRDGGGSYIAQSHHIEYVEVS